MKIDYLICIFLFFNFQSIHGEVLNPPNISGIEPQETDSLQTDTVNIGQGRMLSILIGIRKPGSDEAWRQYINSIFPLAMKHQYDPGVAFNVLEPSRGNYHPGFVAMASWPSPEHREKFQNDPDLPANLSQQRRNIWSRFDQLFYKSLEKEIDFTVRSDKIYVFTGHWIADSQAYKNYEKQALSKMKKFKGKLLVQLPGGSSPKDHLYDPDVWMISEWDNADTFKKYLAELEQSGLYDGLKNTNEFITSYVFNF